MTAAMMWGAPVGVALTGGGLAAAALLLAVLRDRGEPTTPEWRPAELSTLPAAWVPPTGRHRWDAERAADQISSNTRYLGHRSEDEVPSSIGYVLREPVIKRARALVWSLGRTVVRPPEVVTPRQRLVLLALARRLKQVGVRDGLAASLVYRTGRGELP